MATEDILIRYRADVSQLEGDINKVIASQEELTQATQQNTQAQQKAVTSAEFAAKKRAQLLDLEVQKLKQLQQARKLAFDPKEIEKYNQQIAATQRNVALLGDTYQKEAAQINSAQQQINNGNQGILDGINRVGAAFGIAFSVEALIQFGQQAVNAFLDAEAASSRLKFAITEIGGEGEAAFQRLSDQADRFQETTIFDADEIRKAQAALAEFGLTSQQIEDAIPGLLDYASETKDLQGAVQSVGNALEGRAGEFRAFGLQVDAAATKQENLNKVLDTFVRFQGRAAEVTKTTTGQIEQAKNESEDFLEVLGGKIVENLQLTFKILGEIFQPLIDNVIKAKNLFLNLIPDALKSKIDEATNGLSFFEATLRLAFQPIKALGKALEILQEILLGIAKTIGGVVNVFKVGFKEIGDVASNVGGGIADVIDGIAEFDSSKIKSGFNKVKGAFSKAGEDIAKAFNQGYEKVALSALGSAKQVEATNKAAQEASEKIFKSDELRKKSTKELNAELQKQSKIQSNAAKQNVEAIEKELEARKKQGEAAKKAGDEAKKAAEEFKKLIDSIDGEIAKLQSDLERRKIEIIPANSQKAQEDRIKALADLNEKAINDEIAGKIKLIQDDAKLTTEQKNQAIAKYEELKKARLALAQFNEQNELNLINADQVKRIEDAAKQLDDLNIEQALVIEADKVEVANEAVAKSFEDLGKAVSKEDFATAKEAATARTAALNQALNEELNINKTRIENAREAELAKVKEGEAADAERAAINQKYDNQILNATKKTNQDIAENNKNLNDQIETQEAASYERRTQQTFQYLDATAQVLSELGNLYGQFTQQRIDEIEEIKQAEIEAIDESLKINEDNFELRRITEEQFKNEKIRLEKEKVKAEEEALKKVKNLKKQQAILDKTNALFQIAINTAKNITEQPGPFGSLIGLWIALGLAQAGVVAAQPIPYRKGSKDTGPEGHMARVGEEGEEFVWMPANSKVLPARQTKKYADVIDAMYDNKLDDYIYKHYITPQLIAQKQAKESQQSKSFAQNMADSIVYNQSGLTASDLERQRRKGQYINNVDELANAIAKKLPSFDPYRN